MPPIIRMTSAITVASTGLCMLNEERLIWVWCFYKLHVHRLILVIFTLTDMFCLSCIRPVVSTVSPADSPREPQLSAVLVPVTTGIRSAPPLRAPPRASFHSFQVLLPRLGTWRALVFSSVIRVREACTSRGVIFPARLSNRAPQSYVSG